MYIGVVVIPVWRKNVGHRALYKRFFESIP